LRKFGGYFVISTFVFPDHATQWPDFDDHYRHAKRTVVGGMIAVNLVIVIYVSILLAGGLPLAQVPMAQSWISLGAYLLVFPGLTTIWFVKPTRTNLVLLLFMITLLLTEAIGPMLISAPTRFLT
jgi:hypothetical protein